jgi:Ni2+-binding GTPase involved in maturation of urease and hydrogenase
MTDVNLEDLKQDFFRINPRADLLSLSVKTGQGLSQWLEKLENWRREA